MIFMVTSLILLLNLVFTSQVEEVVTFMEVAERGINFYQITSEGEIISVGSLPEFTVSYQPVQGKWIIPYLDFVTVSAEGSRVALIAERDREIRLFIYDTVQQKIYSEERILARFTPEWSPNGRYLWLTPCCLGDATTHDDYIYDVERRVFMLTHLFGGVQWMPDSNGIVIRFFDGIYIVSLDGEIERTLTDITMLNLPDETPICHIKWSEFHQRFYYVVGCDEYPDEPKEMLYSVDPEGNNRQETFEDLSTLYPDATYESIRYIFPDKADIYLFLVSTDAVYAGYIGWHIVRLETDGSLTTVYENKNEGITSSRLGKVNFSPDMTKSVLISNDSVNGGFIIIVDVITGETLVNMDFTDNYVCDSEWLDNQTVVYAADREGFCHPFYASPPIELIKLDVLAHETTNLTEDIEGSIWMLRTPRVKR